MGKDLSRNTSEEDIETAKGMCKINMHHHESKECKLKPQQNIISDLIKIWL